MQRFFEQAKVQMDEFKKSETRLLEENQQLKIAMSRLDGAHKELTLTNSQANDENRRLKDDLTHSQAARVVNWADREINLERARTNVALYTPTYPAPLYASSYATPIPTLTPRAASPARD